MPHAAMQFARCRAGNFAVMFALMLPVLAAFLGFIADQANIANIGNRIDAARDAAVLAVALESVTGNKSHQELEAYAKSFFIANLGKEFEEAASVELTAIKPGRGFQLKARVNYEPFLAPLYAAASGKPGGMQVIEARH